MRKNIISSLLTFIVAATACLLTACSEPAYPEVDIGERTSQMGWDKEKSELLTISAADVAYGSATCPLTVTRTYRHRDDKKKEMQIYRVKSQAKKPAEFVESQKAFMIWVDNVLFRFKDPYKIEHLTTIPEVTLSKLPQHVSLSSFNELPDHRSLEAGRPSFNGDTIPVYVKHLYSRKTTYVTEFIATSSETTAETVDSVDGWVFSLGNQWYNVTKNKVVVPLYGKPTHDLGIRHDMISGEDSESKYKREVIATGWSLNQKELAVTVKQYFEHDTRLETETYILERHPYATYSSYYEGWILEVSGDTYLFDIEGCRSQNSERDSKLQFANVPEQLKRASKRTCSPKPEQPKTEPSKPNQPKDEVNEGRRTDKIQNFDKENMDRRKVTPLKPSDDETTYSVMVTRHYVNVSKTELTRYYIQKQVDAVYDKSKRGYVLEVGKDTYVISKTGKLRQLENN